MSNEDFTRSNLEQFGNRERILAVDLLNAWTNQGLPTDFEPDQIRLEFNTDTNQVYLTNVHFQMAMMNVNKLQSFYRCPDCEEDGFLADLKEEGDCCCMIYLAERGLLETIDSEHADISLSRATLTADMLFNRVRRFLPQSIIDQYEALAPNTEPHWCRSKFFFDCIYVYLNAVAPQGTAFCSHPDDATDFGFWSNDMFE